MNDRELLQPAPAVPDGLRGAVNALLHQIDIGDFVDSNGHSAKMLKPVHDLMRLMSESAAPAVPAYTEGHCEEKAKKGGCQLHNLHCGYPACDRRPAALLCGSRWRGSTTAPLYAQTMLSCGLTPARIAESRVPPPQPPRTER